MHMIWVCVSIDTVIFLRGTRRDDDVICKKAANITGKAIGQFSH